MQLDVFMSSCLFMFVLYYRNRIYKMIDKHRTTIFVVLTALQAINVVLSLIFITNIIVQVIGIAVLVYVAAITYSSMKEDSN